MTTNILL